MGNTDEQMMRRCIQIAKKGLGTTYPNPMVGCVIVHQGKIITEGWHRKAGEHHAEVNAIQQVKDKEILKSSTLYVSLEPCSHQGKTPPCADLIANLGIPKVVIGMTDPNAKVNGQGIKKLEEAGLNVKFNVLKEECEELNKRFLCFHQKKRPYVILKWAKTSDGFMATQSGEQKWITNIYSRQLVHLWRTQENAILIGRKTAVADNPQLNARLMHGHQPIRLVMDRALKLDKQLHLFDQKQPTLVFTEKEKDDLHNLKFITTNFDENPAEAILSKCHENDLQSVIIEGGRQTLQTFLQAGLWDEARIFTSPALWGEGIRSPEINGKIIDRKDIAGDHLEIIRR
ncbi:MAG: bifunctional diaminohydroxyphosphoribosylaminopyrimidine deaminase/5-amino-6-(5-phosphoribosylamino)uracil reductase RibD [Weeksellaceae bacterium]